MKWKPMKTTSIKATLMGYRSEVMVRIRLLENSVMKLNNLWLKMQDMELFHVIVERKH